jgi:hypothetical protein
LASLLFVTVIEVLVYFFEKTSSEDYYDNFTMLECNEEDDVIDAFFIVN